MADVVKRQFMEAISFALKGTKYSNPQDSTSAITIKVIDRKNKKVEHSCDFAIIYYDEDIVDNGYFYLKNIKSQNKYSFEFRKLSVDIEAKLSEILEYNRDIKSIIHRLNFFVNRKSVEFLAGSSTYLERKYDISRVIFRNGVL